jgi:hypothetical protein
VIGILENPQVPIFSSVEAIEQPEWLGGALGGALGGSQVEASRKKCRN